MSLTKYFVEVKNRCLLLLITWVGLFIITYLHKETLLFLCIQPELLTKIDINQETFYFIFTDVTEVFSTYIRLVSFFVSQITFFYLLYHLIVFFSPALYRKEHFYLTLILKLGLFLWGFSIVLLIKVVIPLTWYFFLSFQFLAESKAITLFFEAKINQYLTFFISLYYLCVFYCQIFTIFCFILIYIKANVKIIRKFRKLSYFFFVLFATIISPPEVYSQLFISYTLILLYEILILVLITNFFYKLFLVR